MGGSAVSSDHLLVWANSSRYIQLRRPCQLVTDHGTAIGTDTKLSLHPMSIPETPPSSYITYGSWTEAGRGGVTASAGAGIGRDVLGGAT